jgi:hypothetical protein
MEWFAASRHLDLDAGPVLGSAGAVVDVGHAVTGVDERAWA